MSSPGKVFIIAEIAQAHEGSLGIAHSYIDTLADSGIDAIKFQTHIASAESSEYEPFRVKFSYEDETRYDYWKRMEFTAEQWAGLKQHCDAVGIEFMSSPFSIAAVNLLEQVGVKRYKVGSGEITNNLLLNRIGETGKPVILSSGMSDFNELLNAIDFLKPFGNQVSVLQCTTAYPTQPEVWGLNVIDELRSQFGLPTGFSDHSGDIYACLAAAALGAEILEFHVVFDKGMFGPDAKASLTLSQVKRLTEGVRLIGRAHDNPVEKTRTEGYSELKVMFGKSLAVNRDMKRGDTLELRDLESKKPGDRGIQAKLFTEVIGKKIIKDLPANSFLNYSDLQ